MIESTIKIGEIYCIPPVNCVVYLSNIGCFNGGISLGNGLIWIMTQRKKPLWMDVLPLVLSGIALAFSLITYFITLEDQKDQQAYTFWHDYLHLAVDNPDLARGVYQKTAVEENKYAFFLANALDVAERVYDLQSNDKAWKASIKRIIWNHRCYLHSHPKMISGYYSPDFETLIHEAIDTARFNDCQ